MISEKSLLQGFMKSKEKYMFSEQDFWEKKLFLPWKNSKRLVILRMDKNKAAPCNRM